MKIKEMLNIGEIKSMLVMYMQVVKIKGMNI